MSLAEMQQILYSKFMPSARHKRTIIHLVLWKYRTSDTTSSLRIAPTGLLRRIVAEDPTLQNGGISW